MRPFKFCQQTLGRTHCRVAVTAIDVVVRQFVIGIARECRCRLDGGHHRTALGLDKMVRLRQ